MKIGRRFVMTEEDIPATIKTKYKECPACHKDGLYGIATESQYIDEAEKDVVKEFDIFCNACGDFVDRWNSKYNPHFLTERGK